MKLDNIGMLLILASCLFLFPVFLLAEFAPTIEIDSTIPALGFLTMVVGGILIVLKGLFTDER